MMQKTFALLALLLFIVCLQGYGQSLAAQSDDDLSPVELTEKKVDTVDLSPSPALLNGDAEVPTIITTRPSFTDSWLVVPQGSFQAESGATYTDNSDHTRSWVLPESLLKLGLSKNTEFRFSVPNYTYIRDDDAGKLANTFGDIFVGVSHHIGLPHKIDVSLIPFLNIPTGANAASSNSLDPQFRVVVAKTVTPKLVFASQFDARWHTGRHETAAVVMNPTLISYYNFTEKICGFLEYGGFYPTTGKNSQFIQGGLLYLPTKRQQWDVRIAKGLNHNSSDIVVGFGYSFRIDGLFGASKAFSSFR